MTTCPQVPGKSPLKLATPVSPSLCQQYFVAQYLHEHEHEDA